MQQHIKSFIAAYSVCAHGKSSNDQPGFSTPSLFPVAPGWHIAVDVVPRLPLSNGNATILTMVDRFSITVRFIPLPKLPSAADDIISDCCPQFISQVYRAFCSALGATLSLSSR